MQTKKTSDASTDYSSKTTELENKIPSISGLATNSALTAVGSKIANASSLIYYYSRI